MSTVIRMPEVLTGMTTAVLVSWLVEVGAEVTPGLPLAEVETEKAVVEYQAEFGGVLTSRLIEEGSSVSVGDPIAVLDGDGTETPAVTRTEAAPEAAPEVVHRAVEGTETTRPQRQFATPLVRRLAEEHQISLTGMEGSGPRGRIVRRDLERLLEQRAVKVPPVADGGTVMAHTPMRRAIARRLTQSKTEIPHFYMSIEARVDALLALRREVNDQVAERLSVNDFVIKAVALAMRDVPEANAVWAEDAITRFDQIDIAVAVALDAGLVTPVVPRADQLTIGGLHTEIADLVARSRTGRLKQHELEGGAMSVTNLGMFGIESFAAIINPPHAGIVAVGAVSEKPVVIDGQVSVASVMSVTLSGDHRVMDGVQGAQFLQAIKRRLEHPISLLL